jgi:ABC-type sugar transport system ATPase subunit
VFQNYALYPHMTVFDNIGFGLHAARLPKAEVAARVTKAAGMLGLADYLQRRPAQLSGGQRQRVAMGRAIVRDPAVFLFDEPLSNLDAQLRNQMRTEIKRLHQSIGTTIVYVTHDQVEAMTLADRIVIMRDGRVEQVGAPLDIFHRPANTFVAGFIGAPAMNLLPVQAEGAVAVLADGCRVTLPAPVPAGAGPAAQLGVRPEHLEVSADGPLQLQVEAVERLGATAYVHGRCAGQPLCAELREPGGIAPGQALRLDVRPEKLHVFDAQGLRIPL